MKSTKKDIIQKAVKRGKSLSKADLRGADLRGADLRWANLRGADLRGANLSKADLRWADLSKADLSKANLRWADLRWADLSGANLSGADLSGAYGPFCIGYFGCHHAIAAGGYISIGCERHTYDEWLERYHEIGIKNGYTAKEIDVYHRWIVAAIEALESQ